MCRLTSQSRRLTRGSHSTPTHGRRHGFSLHSSAEGCAILSLQGGAACAGAHHRRPENADPLYVHQSHAELGREAGRNSVDSPVETPVEKPAQQGHRSYPLAFGTPATTDRYGPDRGQGAVVYSPSSMPTSIRFIAALALSGQVLVLGLPWVCIAAGHPASACEETMAPASRVFTATGTSNHAICPNTALCMAIPTAIPITPGTPLLPTAVHAAPPADVAAVNPGDPPAPLSPPPQA